MVRLGLSVSWFTLRIPPKLHKHFVRYTNASMHFPWRTFTFLTMVAKNPSETTEGWKGFSWPGVVQGFSSVHRGRQGCRGDSISGGGSWRQELVSMMPSHNSRLQNNATHGGPSVDNSNLWGPVLHKHTRQYNVLQKVAVPLYTVSWWSRWSLLCSLRWRSQA